MPENRNRLFVEADQEVTNVRAKGKLTPKKLYTNVSGLLEDYGAIVEGYMETAEGGFYQGSVPAYWVELRHVAPNADRTVITSQPKRLGRIELFKDLPLRKRGDSLDEITVQLSTEIAEKGRRFILTDDRTMERPLFCDGKDVDPETLLDLNRIVQRVRKDLGAGKPQPETR